MSAAFAAPAAHAAADVVVSIRELTKRYDELVAADGISLEVRRGEGFGSGIYFPMNNARARIEPVVGVLPPTCRQRPAPSSSTRRACGRCAGTS